jgi:hypothetical protein
MRGYWLQPMAVISDQSASVSDGGQPSVHFESSDFGVKRYFSAALRAASGRTPKFGRLDAGNLWLCDEVAVERVCGVVLVCRSPGMPPALPWCRRSLRSGQAFLYDDIGVLRAGGEVESYAASPCTQRLTASGWHECEGVSGSTAAATDCTAELAPTIVSYVRSNISWLSCRAAMMRTGAGTGLLCALTGPAMIML